MLERIISMLMHYGVVIYQSCNITFDDYTINFWVWVIGFAVLILGCEIVGRILR